MEAEMYQASLGDCKLSLVGENRMEALSSATL